MGCHFGLNVPGSGEAGDPVADLAQAVTADGAVFLASTGFAYGDAVTVGLHERLLALFARRLDGTMSVGAAAVAAKQEYFGTQGLYGAYDEKALASTVALRPADVERRTGTCTGAVAGHGRAPPCRRHGPVGEHVRRGADVPGAVGTIRALVRGRRHSGWNPPPASHADPPHPAPSRRGRHHDDGER